MVVDASALLEVLLRSKGAEPIRRRLFAKGEILCAPHLLDLEIRRFPHLPFLPRI